LYGNFKNIVLAFNKLINPKYKLDDISINHLHFPNLERDAINQFLIWDDIEKNKTIYSLINYSLEYSVISNNVSNANFLENSVKNKTFYIDNNVIYRAIGIDGENKKNRIRTFLNKCIESGAKIYVSKYTIKEFNETIDFHISQLQKVPFRRINPSLFNQYTNNSGIYGFYHNWKSNRRDTGYHFKVFRAYLQDLYHKFLSEFSIKEDYKINFDETNPENLKTILRYKENIMTHKGYGREENIELDALNTFFVEQKRGENNKNIIDTKYYFISTDKRLRNWDFARNEFQPIALLPNHWMAILLKFFTRSDDDFKSFVSFLRIPNEELLITQEDLQIVLSGISEITEDFESQEVILEHLINSDFKSIIEGKDIYEKQAKAYSFARETFDKEFKKMEKGHKEELDRIEIENRSLIREKQINHKHEIVSELENQQASLTRIKTPLDVRISNRIKFYKIMFWSVILIYYAILLILTIAKGWNVMEPIIYFFSLAGLILGMVYVFKYGHSFNPKKHFNYIETQIMTRIYNKANFELAELEQLKKRINEMIGDLDILTKD